jgi:predicted PurR-regulated permease PerM
MSRQQLFAGFFFAVFLFLLYQFYRVFSFFIVPLSWGALLTLIFYPLQLRLFDLLRQRRGLAAFLLTTAVIAIVIVPTIYLSVLLATQSVSFVQQVRAAVESGQVNLWIEQLRASRPGQLWARFAPQLAAWHIDLPALALKASNALSAGLVANVGDIAANALRFIVNFFLTTFALFFFFRDGERMVRGVRELLPMEPAHKDAILARLYATLSAVVQGTLVTAVAQGLLAGIGFAILDVPFAVLLGCATAFVSLIPMGTPLVWLSVVGYFLLHAAYGRAIAMALWGILIVGTADNVLRPLIIGGRTQIPTIFLFFGILGGLQAYGFLGVFVGPTLIAILVAFIRIYREEYGTADEAGGELEEAGGTRREVGSGSEEGKNA